MIKHDLAKYDIYKVSEIIWLNHIPIHWIGKRVKELSVTISKGTTPTTEGFAFTDEGVRFIKAENIGNTKVVSMNPAFFISEEANFVLIRSQLRVNDLLIVIAGATIGKIGIVFADLLPANTNQAVCFIRFKKQFNVDFLYYLFASDYFSKFIWYSVVQSAQPNLSMGVLGNLLFYMPPPSEQKAIADYLDTKTAQIDRKIDLLTQKATQYGKLKQSLINETVTRGLDKTVAMKDSGVEWIGKVPKHWKVCRIKDYSYVKGRIGWQGLRYSDFLEQGDYFCVTGTDLVGGLIDWSNCYYVTKERYEQDKYIQLKLKDLLITKDGTIGKIALIDKLPLRTTLNSGVFVTRPLKSQYINEYMFWVLNSTIFKNFIDLTKGGSTIQHLYQNVFDRFTYGCPPLNEQQAIADYLDIKTAHIDRIVETINIQIDKLKELRKTLINDVVTGKIRVAVKGEEVL